MAAASRVFGMLFWHLLCVAWSPWTAVASNNLLSNYDLPVSFQLNYSDEPAKFKMVCLSTLSSRGIKLGAGELGIGSSGIEGAMNGLFSRVECRRIMRRCMVESMPWKLKETAGGYDWIWEK